ncbi:hypothetical protein R1flu_029034 [Riccia fluitans]|uniref:Uncharacterized protein n=1 Tax=Riccia fluitans TaxID=41844 RepID=A0ABD1XNF2_9MARC
MSMASSSSFQVGDEDLEVLHVHAGRSIVIEGFMFMMDNYSNDISHLGIRSDQHPEAEGSAELLPAVIHSLLRLWEFETLPISLSNPRAPPP